MNVSRRYPARLVLALAAAALVLVIGAASAFGQGAAPSGDPSGGGGVSGTTGSMGIGVGTTIAVPPDSPVASGIAAPAWCCGTSGYVPGLTVIGQATVDGQDPSARDVAIAAAVQDATAQANVAADAAGIQLGAIIDMQVSAMPYFYPMMGTTSGSSGSSPGSGGGGMEPAPDPYFGSVSVTITWSLG
ncbi:MAG: SIMPL domain-containing protein [Actinomycetota bacterium]